MNFSSHFVIINHNNHRSWSNKIVNIHIDTQLWFTRNIYANFPPNNCSRRCSFHISRLITAFQRPDDENVPLHCWVARCEILRLIKYSSRRPHEKSASIVLQIFNLFRIKKGEIEMQMSRRSRSEFVDCAVETRSPMTLFGRWWATWHISPVPRQTVDWYEVRQKSHLL